MGDQLPEEDRAFLPVTITQELAKSSVDESPKLIEADKPQQDDGGSNAATPTPTNSPSLPERTASPVQVREYIRELLTCKHNLTPEYADFISGKWMVLRGWSLRGMTQKQFIEFFGKDIGPHLYWDVWEDKRAAKNVQAWKRWKEWRESTRSRDYQYATGLSFIFAALMMLVRNRVDYACLSVAIPQLLMGHLLPSGETKKMLLLFIGILLALAFFTSPGY